MMQHCPPMKRRTLFRLGLVGAVVLAGGGLLAVARPGWAGGRLTPEGRALFAALAPTVLEQLLPAAPDARASAIAAHLQRVEGTIAAFAPAIQAEIAQMLGLLLHPAGRVAFTGLRSEWTGADPAEVAAALQSLRGSTLELKQQVFHALRDLTVGAWFAGPDAWQAIGYPGPRPI